MLDKNTGREKRQVERIVELSPAFAGQF